jgi:hypothetical protein
LTLDKTTADVVCSSNGFVPSCRAIARVKRSGSATGTLVGAPNFSILSLD